MKLPKFDYERPASLQDAVSLLAREDSKVLAGGQSLLPMMAYRLAAPSLLVDIRNIPEISDVRFGEKSISIGSCVRWRDILMNAELRARHPLIVEAVTHVAHYQIRNRGTIGGSLAHADPAAEMPAVALCCEATVRIFGRQGWREIPIEEFLIGPLATSLEPDEILVEINFPNWNQRRKYSFSEFARRKGDFALAGICVTLDFGEATLVKQARVVCFGASEQQVRLSETEAFLETIKLTADACREAGRIAQSEVQAATDIHSSAEYRKSLCGTLLRRGLTEIMTDGCGNAN